MPLPRPAFRRFSRSLPKIYIETTILSYLAARPSRDLVTAGRLTNHDTTVVGKRARNTRVASSEVQEECEQGADEDVGLAAASITQSTSGSWSKSEAQRTSAWNRADAEASEMEAVGFAAEADVEFHMPAAIPLDFVFCGRNTP